MPDTDLTLFFHDAAPDAFATGEAATLRGIIAHNDIAAGIDYCRAVGAFLRDADGTIVGGVTAYTHWDWLAIELLWVEKSLRGKGWGTRLMDALETRADAMGCRHAYLDTFDFQARPFYEKRGYVVFGQLPGFPAGHTRFFLVKHW